MDFEMDWKIFLTVFGSVFIAEMADKTQLATILYAANPGVSKWMVFFAASLALIAASAVAVTVGAAVSHVISARTMTVVAGVGFILIGGWILWQGLASS
jgi:putative Ca2+/H+ antiporter (TMEM165/GDT1 family)